MPKVIIYNDGNLLIVSWSHNNVNETRYTKVCKYSSKEKLDFHSRIHIISRLLIWKPIDSFKIH